METVPGRRDGGTKIETSSIEDLRDRLRGKLIVPGDPGYDEARRVWNGDIDRRPALIVRCTGVADVRDGLAFGRRHGLPVSIRGGGHNVSGSAVAEGGLMLDLSPMRTVRIDPVRRLVRVDPGVTLGGLDRETQVHGLAVPAGIVTTTGVAGLTLGGGIGWLMRRHGLTSDRLRSADVLTADGELHVVGDDREPDLFWAIRGGGGNFGIVTSFEFEAPRVGPEVLAGMALYSLEDGVEVLRAYRDWAGQAPDEVTTILALRTVLPLPAIPAPLHGRRVVLVGACHVGEPGEAERSLAPLRRLHGAPLLDTIARKPFLAHQRTFEASVPWGHGYYWKSLFLDRLSDPAIERLVERAAFAAQPWSYVILFELGGAVGRVPEEACAYSGRTAGFAVNINGVWEPGAGGSAERAWTRDLFEALAPHAGGGVYVNFLGDEGEDRVRAAYGAAKYERLVELKTRYDPGNVFRLNQNIPPRTAAPSAGGRVPGRIRQRTPGT
jgi:FAD/FMN-containing dehydrogenase